MKKTYVLLAVATLFLGLWYMDSRSVSLPTSVKNPRTLPMAVDSKIVDLKDGDAFDLTAQVIKKKIAGKEVPMFGYNGSVPGPTIRVPQGAEITIQFKNELDIPTTLHSHGVRMENAFDGVPDVTQKEIKPGETFTYKLRFPDAGVFWYHPHVREDYTQEMGLAGNFLVTPRDPAYWNTVDREVALMVDDILLEKNGSIAPFGPVADHALMGRFGNVMLVNGETDYTLSVNRGEVVRFFVTNVANVRPFRIVLLGAKMKLVGGDSGAYEQETWADAVTLGPSERAVVEVLFEKAGEVFLQNKTPEKATTLGKIVVTDAPQPDPAIGALGANWNNLLRSHMETIANVKPFRVLFAKAPDKKIALTVDMMGGGMGNMGGGHMMPDGSTMGGGMMMSAPVGGVEWEDDGGMMGNQTSEQVIWTILDQATNKRNMDIDWKFKVGDRVKIRISNDAHSMHPMQHPIHIHGQRFLVLNKNGVEQKNLVWKDTVLVPAGEYVDILLDVSNPGTWMTHCHISEHLESGMMFNFTVEK